MSQLIKTTLSTIVDHRLKIPLNLHCLIHTMPLFRLKKARICIKIRKSLSIIPKHNRFHHSVVKARKTVPPDCPETPLLHILQVVFLDLPCSHQSIWKITLVVQIAADLLVSGAVVLYVDLWGLHMGIGLRDQEGFNADCIRVWTGLRLFCLNFNQCGVTWPDLLGLRVINFDGLQVGRVQIRDFPALSVVLLADPFGSKIQKQLSE